MNDDLNVLDYTRAISQRRKLVFIVVTCFLVAAITYLFFAPKTYKATGTLLPIGGNQSSGIASAAATVGLGAIMGLDQLSPGAPLIAVLESRTLAGRVIRKLDLGRIYFPELWDAKNRQWLVPEKQRPSVQAVLNHVKKALTIKENQDLGTILISFEAEQPQMASDVVNTYVEELGNYLVENELTTAKRNRIFIEKQLETNKIELLKTGKELSLFYKQNPVSGQDPGLDIDVLINGDLVRGMPESKIHNIEALEQKRDAIEKNIQKARLVEDVPQQIYLEYLSDYYLLLKDINSTLTHQYELAKINEAKEDLSFQVIDWGAIPEGKYKPFTIVILLIGFTGGLFLALFLVFLAEYFHRLRIAEKIS